MTPSQREAPRPKIAAEVRAWIAVTVAIILQAMGAVWWAATLSAELKALREVVSEMKLQVSGIYTSADAVRDLAPIRERMVDHEQRLRGLELRGVLNSTTQEKRP